MPFPVVQKTDAVNFKLLIEHYYSDLQGKLNATASLATKSKDKLVDDYATIGSFLSDPEKVRAALVPLEERLRAKATEIARTKTEFAIPANVKDVAKYVTPAKDSDQTMVFKSHRLLSSVLLEGERESGFNHEKFVKGTMIKEVVAEEGTLHSKALMSDGKSSTLGVAGRTSTTKVPLPSGVPSVIGEPGGLDGMTFNNVLLRHGYQFKDIAAGPYHGEYSHRLQWHAIASAASSHVITLHNSPLEIFRSMGYLACKADKNLASGRHLYIWEMLFDAGISDKNAIEISGTLAYCTDTYNSPEKLNKDLMSLINCDVSRVDSLWYLRVLVKTRWKKRFDDTDSDDPFKKVKAKTKLLDSKMAAMVGSGETATSMDDLKGLLVWYLRTD